MGSSPVAVTKTSEITSVYSKEFRDIQAITECGSTLKRVLDMTRTHSPMHHTDKYSQHTSIICPVWLNDIVFVYDLRCCAFVSCCIHLNFRYRVCFEQRIPWHSGNYWEWIHSEMLMWHDKNIKSNTPYR